MKTLLFILCFSFTVFSQSIQDRVNQFDKPKDYEVRYDKFQKVTEVAVKEQLIKSHQPNKFLNSNLHLSIDLWLGDSGDKFVFLSFREVNSCRTSTLRLLLNDKDVIELEDDTIDCLSTFSVNPKQLEQIANAKTVEMQLNSFEGKFDSKTLDVFVNLLTLTKPLRPLQK